jgi:hypothetical protein
MAREGYYDRYRSIYWDKTMKVLELKNPIYVHTHHGYGKALLIFDYGIDHNSVWGVRLHETGAFKHYDSEDIRVYGNPMAWENLNPEIPIEWKQ